MVDPRTPVLIGVGQLSNRVDRGEAALEPVDLIVEALRRAADDSGVGDGRCSTGADAVHIVVDPLVALPRPGRASSPSGSAPPRATPPSGHGRQQPADRS